MFVRKREVQGKKTGRITLFYGDTEILGSAWSNTTGDSRFPLCSFTFTLSGCNKDEVTTEVFEGDLKIAIVGEKSKIKEKSVDFSVLKLEEIKENPRRISKEYDDCKFF